jgi:hypothetical protein
MKTLKSSTSILTPRFSTNILLKIALCLVIFQLATTLAYGQQYASITMVDLAHKKAVVAGDSYDGRLYHQKPNIDQRDAESSIRDNAKWMFKPAGQDAQGKNYYQILDRRHGVAIVAGYNYDGNVYHQEPGNTDNTLWQLHPVEGQEGYFYIIDKKHGKALVAGNNHDGNLYHQDDRARSNAKWLLNIEEGSGFKPAPKELIVEQEVINIQYHLDKKKYVPGGRPDIVIISDTEENRSGVDGTYRFSETETKKTSETYTITNESTRSVTVKIGTQFGYNSGSTGGFFGSTSIGLDVQWTTKSGETKSNTIEKTFSFTAEKSHPLPACTKAEYHKRIEGKVATIPFTMHVKRTYGDGSSKVEYVDGTWEGVEFIEGEGTIELSPIAGCNSHH